MKILFCAFSGTGNTYRVAGRIMDGLNELGHETALYKVRYGAEHPLLDVDVVVFCYPVHAFNAPRPMLAFIKSFVGSGQKAYIVRVSGEPLALNDAAGIKPRRLLRKSGFQVLGEFSFVMPYNIIFRHSDEMAARMWLCAENRAKKAASDIAALVENRCRVNIFKRAVAFTLRIEHVAMPKIGRHFKTTDDCVGCGKCVSLCPVSNITIASGKPEFGKKCAGCMACAFGCPKDAIRISLLNGWRVNGGYAFDGRPASDDEVCSYCHKSYIRYFISSEETEAK